MNTLPVTILSARLLPEASSGTRLAMHQHWLIWPGQVHRNGRRRALRSILHRHIIDSRNGYNQEGL
jgi:hypothetical protein